MVDDGNAALATLDRRRHGLVLTDAQMPLLDGWQLTHAIRQVEAVQGLSRMPIMMVTANALAESDSRASDLDLDAVLTKPLQLDELEAALLGALPILGFLRVAAGDGRMSIDQLPETIAPPEGTGGEIDLEVLIGLVGDEPDILRSMLDDFQAGVSTQHDQLRAALDLGDPAVLARHAHSIKGAARYAGATRLAQICDALEQRASANASFEALVEDLAALDAAVAKLPTEVAAALARRVAIGQGALEQILGPYSAVGELSGPRQAA